MSEHDEKADERVEDLDVPESESEDVKGGLLPAIGQSGWKLDKQSPLTGEKFNIADKLNPGTSRLGDGSV
jgi:hypothetical protein